MKKYERKVFGAKINEEDPFVIYIYRFDKRTYFTSKEVQDELDMLIKKYGYNAFDKKNLTNTEKEVKGFTVKFDIDTAKLSFSILWEA